jgi:transcriptional regulator with XRE-family HTH domain
MEKNIGGRLKEVRNRLGYKTQEPFAVKIGTSQTTLSKYENGTIDIPDDLKIKISEFGINIHWLITGEGEMFLESQNAVENSEQYDEKTARVAELEEKIKVLENQEARVKSLEAENKQLSEDLLEMLRPNRGLAQGGNWL